ncbi:DUF2793 domain-containing protein [Amaricoccus macauensis]|uniref:DUF2793 domain-containing protein n=1 Tax=Amaricoccus macauensis TaxID=57001 RepID=UPI003C7C433D
MPERILPGLGLRAFYDPGQTDWGTPLSEDLRRLSALVQARALSQSTPLPASGATGDIFLVPEDADENASNLALWDGASGSEAWVFLAPQTGWEVLVLDEGVRLRFNGTGWVETGSHPDVIGNAGRVLSVRSDESGVEWAQVSGIAGATAEGSAVFHDAILSALALEEVATIPIPENVRDIEVLVSLPAGLVTNARVFVNGANAAGGYFFRRHYGNGASSNNTSQNLDSDFLIALRGSSDASAGHPQISRIRASQPIANGPVFVEMLTTAGSDTMCLTSGVWINAGNEALTAISVGPMYGEGWSAGARITARDLEASGVGIPFRGALAVMTATHVHATTGSWTPLAWDAVSYDSLGFWSAAEPSRLTVPAGVTRVRLKAGLKVDGSDTMPASNALAIRRNGESVAEGTIRTEGLDTPGTTISTPVLEVAEGDVFDLAAWVGESFATGPEATFLAIEVVEATGLTTTLRELGDTDLQTTAPAGGDALIWDVGSGKWVPGALPDPANVTLTGGTIDGVAIGGSEPAAAAFSSLGVAAGLLSISSLSCDWGNLSLTGETSGKDIRPGQNYTMRSSRSEAGNAFHHIFYDASGGIAGTIRTDGAGSTTFNTTSDERLKSDRQDFDPGPILDAIPVHDFAMFGRRRRGFSSAQAMHTVFPEAVTPGEGAPDEPHFVPWSIDPSALVPLLVREVQLLRARVSALEAGQTGSA